MKGTGWVPMVHKMNNLAISWNDQVRHSHACELLEIVLVVL